MTTTCANCSSTLNEGSLVCPQCGTAAAADTRIAETGSTDVPAYKPANDLNGIGGWLILPAIGLAISPFISLYGIATDIQLLTGNHPSLFANHPSLTGLLIFEVIINAAFFAALICLNILFYTKKRILPKGMIAFYAAQCVLMLADHLAAVSVFPSVDLSSGLMTVIRSFIVAAIWIPYFLNSIRVESTFVN
jgi:hypothetical protein